ncbi:MULTISPECIES: methyltransferase domain-containing protein [Thermomonospora]|uniref:Protein-L-isoaspartate O-methyltransferase n=1 Tax=Thermomonospora curvata (strain ATCC 19995 / DSM 43183 / JCM 3096 / KCTC 9072 / NBRC 15933 / NCIMB 10081 / Henssen B9) TaxID=471852 RepID=D1ACZ8_THECD|nr:MULTISPECIES: methyltransferase domain-containing protein [Thermomonospora]ACY99307.1 Protein-L-isoaspartate(D-aspartate)O-methyltrans ferase [Thermomonospora curvata DSM 43183]PKK12363.1 MAG: protein-L-isoaspartate(D-aspartate) O-methyltransferase [Thermomonospora sp. CIF 1]
MDIEGAVKAVPREPFIPDTIWVFEGEGMVPLSRADDPERWAAIVRSGEPVVIQVDDGKSSELPLWPTSSSSAPEIVVEMLKALRLEAGMRVLEVGTGSGWNAALLAHLLGPQNVTTVEVDATLAVQARRALHRAGYPVTVVADDGEKGYPPNAPYDRIIVTAAACEVPYAWVEQTRPGGLILVPWGPTVHPDDPLAVLTVSADGMAEGRFVGPAWFMPLRGQRKSQAVAHQTRERWVKLGKPDCTRFGVTVSPEGQRIWLDSPHNVL